MIILRNPDDFPDDMHGGALTIGKFDGVHRGHALIMERLVAASRRLGGPAVVFTFEPMPAAILRPDKAPRPLTWIARKADLLGKLGVDLLFTFPTTVAFLQQDARSFFRRIVLELVGARALVEGTDFHFGRARQGDVRLMAQFCDETGISLDVVEPMQFEDEVISSSRIRKVLQQGDVALARQMLTEPFRVHGPVIHGAGRGRTLGFPTANIDVSDTLLPKDGTYAGRGFIDGRVFPAAINLGPNPTFDDMRQKFEIYLIGYEGSLYDQEIEIDFLERLRDITTFPDRASLLVQMERDLDAVRATFDAFERANSRSD